MVHINHEIKRRLEKLNPVCRSYLFKRARKFLWPLPWQTDSLWNPVDKRKCKQYRKKRSNESSCPPRYQHWLLSGGRSLLASSTQTRIRRGT